MSSVKNPKTSGTGFWNWIFPIRYFEFESTKSISELEECLQSITQPSYFALPNSQKKFCGDVGGGQFQLLWHPFMFFTGTGLRGRFFELKGKTKICVEIGPHRILSGMIFGTIILACSNMFLWLGDKDALLPVTSSGPVIVRLFILVAFTLFPAWMTFVFSHLYRMGLVPSKRALMETLR